MNVVPKYAIIGNGQVAQHISHYFTLSDINFLSWDRATKTIDELSNILNKVSHVLVLITDQGIDPFIQNHIIDKYNNLTLIHFSGALVSEYAIGAHPLQSFNQNNLYSLAEYQQIPFILDNNSLEFKKILPGLCNPHYTISKQDKPYYHAMCVLANNLTSLVWQKFNQEMTTKFGINQADLHPILERTFLNIKENPNSALTGPLVRKDIKTLEKNLASLTKDPFHNIFKSVIQQFATGDRHENCQ